MLEVKNFGCPDKPKAEKFADSPDKERFDRITYEGHEAGKSVQEIMRDLNSAGLSPNAQQLDTRLQEIRKIKMRYSQGQGMDMEGMRDVNKMNTKVSQSYAQAGTPTIYIQEKSSVKGWKDDDVYARIQEAIENTYGWDSASSGSSDYSYQKTGGNASDLGSIKAAVQGALNKAVAQGDLKAGEKATVMSGIDFFMENNFSQSKKPVLFAEEEKPMTFASPTGSDFYPGKNRQEAFLNQLSEWAGQNGYKRPDAHARKQAVEWWKLGKDNAEIFKRIGFNFLDKK